MNFAKLQQAMKGRALKGSPFSASNYIENVSKSFSWVDTYFTGSHDNYLDVAAQVYQECAFEEIEVQMDVVDMLALEE